MPVHEVQLGGGIMCLLEVVNFETGFVSLWAGAKDGSIVVVDPETKEVSIVPHLIHV